MKVFREAQLSSRSFDETRILEHVQRFAEQTSGYAYLIGESESYSRGIACPGCVIRSDRTTESEAAEIVIAPKKPSVLYVANVVPLDRSRLTIEEYNAVICRFIRDFRNYVNSLGVPISARQTKDEIGLKEIISGKRTRQLFSAYLSLFPTSHHPLSIQRLDIFICTLSRYRCNINLLRLGRYLREDLNWAERDASWCVERIATGLDILKVNRRL